MYCKIYYSKTQIAKSRKNTVKMILHYNAISIQRTRGKIDESNGIRWVSRVILFFPTYSDELYI